jgi:hypothetical protein
MTDRVRNLGQTPLGWVFNWVATEPEDPILDPQLAIDTCIEEHIRCEPEGEVHRLLTGALEVLDQVIAGGYSEQELEAAMTDATRVSLPDGPNWREYLRVLRITLREALDGKALLPPSIEVQAREGLTLERAGRFTDLQTANDAVTEVLRAHEPKVRAWAADQGGWARQHYFHDTGREVGRIMTREDGGQSRPATAVVVVMAMDPESGNPYVLTSYPEVQLDVERRRKYPDLCHWFGGWFNQDHGIAWNESQDVQLSTTDPARSRVREQLTRLLEEPDDTELLRVLDACGSYALPKKWARVWIYRTLWRLDAFDWSGDRSPFLSV